MHYLQQTEYEYGTVCMIGNFRKGFIFAFFMNQEPFTKMKFLMPAMHGKQIAFQSGTTSKYPAILTPI